MTASRRHVLSVLAASPALASLSTCAPMDLPDPVAAWRSPGAGETDPRRFALAHAILAPNPHNLQPWLIELSGPDELLLFFDSSRRLPQTDPFDRQITIGFGAFLELFAIASAEMGLKALVTPFPSGFDATRLDERPVAHVRLNSGAARDRLYSHIGDRRSHKERFDVRPLTAEAIGALNPTEQARGTTDASAITFGAALGGEPRAETIRELIPLAYRREVETPAAHRESVDLMRIGRREIATYRDGIAIDFPGVDALKALGVVTRDRMLTPGSRAYEEALTLYDPLAASAAGFVWLMGPSGRADQLAAGRLYARMNLIATATGVAMHPISQALQEYPEMADLKAQMDRAVDLAEGQVLQMLARVGYAAPVPPTPRRGLEQHLR